MTDAHIKTIIEDKLDVSYEPETHWYSGEGSRKGMSHAPAEAVLLVTRCCEVNHDHINLNKEQAMVLAEWLVAFANGEYDE